jgi:hypothetical protein
LSLYDRGAFLLFDIQYYVRSPRNLTKDENLFHG